MEMKETVQKCREQSEVVQCVPRLKLSQKVELQKKTLEGESLVG